VKWLTLGVAAYAAILATIEAVSRWRERRRGRRSLVSVSTSWLHHAEGPDTVEIEIHNLSPEPIRVHEYGWFSKGAKLPLPNKPRSWFGWRGEGDALEIPPRDGDAIEGSMHDVDVAESDLDRPLVSWIRLTTGEEFTAPPIPIPPGASLRDPSWVERRRSLSRDRPVDDTDTTGNDRSAPDG
jgi:hypothetical protein